MKKKKVKKLSYYRGKADKILQDIGRLTYDKCLICGGEYSCLHHFILKSQSTELRYNMKNLIPICSNCHCAIHQGKSSGKVGEIVLIKGMDWLNELLKLKRLGIGKYYGRQYFEEMYKKLKLLTPYRV